MDSPQNINTTGMVNGKKTYYSISEVCSLTGLEPHVLRYWESEFSQLRPKKNRAGNRAYRDKDIQVVRFIKRLLYEEQFTIPGAKRKLTEPKVAEFEIDGTEIGEVSTQPANGHTIENPHAPELQSAPQQIHHNQSVPATHDETPVNGKLKEHLRQELTELLELLTR